MSGLYHHITLFIRKTIAPLAGAFVLSISASFAQSAQQDSIKTKALNDAVVTGQYGENSLQQSVFKVKVIDVKRIQMQGAVNLKDVLANEMNIRINQDPSLGSSISLQGVTGQNIKILVDGIPVVGRENGNIDLNQINLNNVERIELVEGPMSVNFGSDALGGVINIITRKAEHRSIKVDVGSFYESIGQYNIDAGIATGGKNNTLTFRIGRNFFDGYDPHEEQSRFRMWKPREQYLADFSLGLTKGSNQLRWQNSFMSEKVTAKDSGVITPFYAYGLDQYFYTNRLTSSLFWDKKLKKDKLISVLGSVNYYHRVRNTMRKDLVTLNEEPTNAAELNDTNAFLLIMSRGSIARNKSKARFNYQTGYEVNYESTTGGKIDGEYRSISDYNLFASSEIKARHNLVIRPGLRLIYNSRFNAPVVPALNVKWEVSSQIKIRASYARGFRAPSLKELYLSFVDPSHNVFGNPNLKAETGDNIQVFTSYEITKQKHLFRIEPSIFYNHINNQIELAREEGNTLKASYINIGWFSSLGVNVNTEYKTPTYGFQFGYGYAGRTNSYSPTEQYYFSNEYRFNFTYTHPKKQTSLALFYKYNGKVQAYQYQVFNNEVSLGYINAYQLLDASISQPFWKKRLQCTAGIKNILDVTNIQANLSGGVHQASTGNAMIAMGRTYFISIRFTLSKNS